MKISLQGRLIVLIVVFSIFFIAIFTSIQAYNQLRRSMDFNYHRAGTGALLLQLNLKNVLKNIAVEDPARKDNAIKDVINSLHSSNIIEKALIIDTSGNIIYATENFSRLNYADQKIIEKNFKGPYSQDKIYSDLDRKAKTAKLFIPVSGNMLAITEYNLGNIYKALSDVYIPVMITVIIVIITNIFLATLLSRSIISPISLLNTVTGEIACGNLDRQINIKSGDELEELAGTFNYMTKELKKMKQRAENANPLTKLPGNIMIQEEVEKRIKNNQRFLIMYCDLDNFKAFNDKYGIEAGDKAIKLTSDIFKEAIDKKGKKDDFIGHEGGDDFILLTKLDRAQEIAGHITSEFDKRIKQFYSDEDLAKGYIEAKSRQGQVMKFPIMTISLAGVTNELRPINSYAEAANIAADVKKKAKAIEGSNLFIDRRKEPWPPNAPRPV